MFLFNDTQIMHEGFLEDINNILNAGECRQHSSHRRKLLPAVRRCEEHPTSGLQNNAPWLTQYLLLGVAWHAAGEVPDLLGADDLEEIASTLRPIMAAAGMPITKMSIHNFFVSRCDLGLPGDSERFCAQESKYVWWSCVAAPCHMHVACAHVGRPGSRIRTPSMQPPHTLPHSVPPVRTCVQGQGVPAHGFVLQPCRGCIQAAPPYVPVAGQLHHH